MFDKRFDTSTAFVTRCYIGKVLFNADELWSSFRVLKTALAPIDYIQDRNRLTCITVIRVNLSRIFSFAR